MSDKIDKIDDIELCNVTNGDFDVPASRQLCRAVMSDIGGTIKVRQKCYATGEEFDQILILHAGVWKPDGNIIKVYRYLTGTTATTSQVYTSSYVAVNGIKLGY